MTLYAYSSVIFVRIKKILQIKDVNFKISYNYNLREEKQTAEFQFLKRRQRWKSPKRNLRTTIHAIKRKIIWLVLLQYFIQSHYCECATFISLQNNASYADLQPKHINYTYIFVYNFFCEYFSLKVFLRNCKK